MARTPCFRCDERFAGDAHNVYWTYYDGEEFVKLRYIVCKGCVEEMASDWVGKALHRGADNRWHDADDDETLTSLLRASGSPPDAIRWQKVS